MNIVKYRGSPALTVFSRVRLTFAWNYPGPESGKSGLKEAWKWWAVWNDVWMYEMEVVTLCDEQPGDQDKLKYVCRMCVCASTADKTFFQYKLDMRILWLLVVSMQVLWGNFSLTGLVQLPDAEWFMAGTTHVEKILAIKFSSTHVLLTQS